MSATLTDVQINTLKQQYLRNGNCVVLTGGVHGDNVQISMQRYKQQKQQSFDEGNDDDDDDNDVNEETENQISVAQHYPLTGGISIWGHIINN